MVSSEIFSLQGKTVVVVGAGSGIGEAVAIGCASHGARVACADIKLEGAKATAGRINSESADYAFACEVDVRDGASVKDVFGRVRDQWGSLDCVISTPGVNVRQTLDRYTSEDFDYVIDVNLRGSVHVLQSGGEIMKEQGSGSMVLFSSIRSLVVEPGQSVYAATKAGIVQLVRTVAAELGPHGVRVNAIAPGVVDTPLTAPIKESPDWYGAYADRNIMKRWGSTDEMVGPTVFLCSEAASYVTGAVLFVDGGWTAIDGRFQPPGM